VANDSSQLARLAADLEAGRARVGARAAAVVRKTALDLEATAKNRAPVDTGALKNSISTDFAGDGPNVMAAEIGPTVHYGAYVEYGTSRMSPQPYMGPALDVHSAAYLAALGQTAEDLL
jgi:HK97 gp10 family phage protein